MNTSIKSLFAVAVFLFAGLTPSLAHSDKLKPEFVDTLVPAYLDLQKALAGDDLGAAQAAATQLATLARKGDDLDDLAAYADQLAGEAHLKAARADFAEVTVEFTKLVEHVGTTGQQPLYLAHCPMAFGGKGGDWVQGDKNVLNPYYGAMMLRCGGIKQQLAGKDMAAGNAHH